MGKAVGKNALSETLGFVVVIREEVITVGGKSEVTEGVTT